MDDLIKPRDCYVVWLYRVPQQTNKLSDNFEIVLIKDLWFSMVMPLSRKAVVRRMFCLLEFMFRSFVYVLIAYCCIVVKWENSCLQTKYSWSYSLFILQKYYKHIKQFCKITKQPFLLFILNLLWQTIENSGSFEVPDWHSGS